MMASSSTYVMLCLLSCVSLNFALTNKEAGMFESHEINVIRGSDVHGRVAVSIKGSDGTHTLKSNGIPDHAIDAHDRIKEQKFRMKFPQNPTLNDKPTCLPASSIVGFAINGVPIFSPFDKNSKNVNVGLKAKSCQGRTGKDGVYFYAQLPNRCSTFTSGYQGHDPYSIYGVAADGFPIYGPGLGEITNADLDPCHGKMVDGQYRYYMTDEWPYILGCFRGTPVDVDGAPTGKNVCKFACNKRSKFNDTECKDDFPIIHKEL
ncbi:uncharacterized protein [Amphiura filiformis]|uniref:uncharacterized protein n=1 Tax=Amphiura filiformis TaxID=82378 RepID=UPI003B20D886